MLTLFADVQNTHVLFTHFRLKELYNEEKVYNEEKFIL